VPAGAAGIGVIGGSAGTGGAPVTGGSATLAGAGSGGSSGRAASGGAGLAGGAPSGTGGNPGAGQAGTSTGGANAQGGTGGRGGANTAGSGGKAGSNAGQGGGAGGALPGTCPSKGNVTYTLAREASPTPAQSAAYEKITTAVEKALSYYNCYTSITKELRVSYVPSVQTADGNVNGSIRFGSDASMNYITAMHEMGHTVGIGSTEWGRLLLDGLFTGAVATAKLREITNDPSAEVHGDAQHFWPYGLNFTSEVESEADLINHCYMVVAIREDIY
jgi:hypothetical protein